MDMRFYWVKDRVKQGQCNVYSGPGYQNLADFFTKHHLPAHHKIIREIYIHASERPMNKRGIRDISLFPRDSPHFFTSQQEVSNNCQQ
jgi:hypothetical protein